MLALEVTLGVFDGESVMIGRDESRPFTQPWSVPRFFHVGGMIYGNLAWIVVDLFLTCGRHLDPHEGNTQLSTPDRSGKVVSDHDVLGLTAFG